MKKKKIMKNWVKAKQYSEEKLKDVLIQIDTGRQKGMSSMGIKIRKGGKKMEKYKIKETCFNCRHDNNLEIEKGKSVREFLKENNFVCENCGCSHSRWSNNKDKLL